jgi:hypothetical protein
LKNQCWPKHERQTAKKTPTNSKKDTDRQQEKTGLIPALSPPLFASCTHLMPHPPLLALTWENEAMDTGGIKGVDGHI